MKIDTLTYPRSLNYGAFLQAVCLCNKPINEKHNIKVVVDHNQYSFLVDLKPALSIKDRKKLIDKDEDNEMIMIFYNRNGEINCGASSLKGALIGSSSNYHDNLFRENN